MIHTYADGACAISSGRGWRPGIYDNEKTARYAIQLDNLLLSRVSKSKPPGESITKMDLRNAAKG